MKTESDLILEQGEMVGANARILWGVKGEGLRKN